MTAVLRRSFVALHDRGFGLAIPCEAVRALADRREGDDATVASISASLGLAPSGESRGARLVVLGDGDARVAFAVDEVLGVIEVDASDVLAMPELVRRTLPALLSLALVDGRSLVVVDAEGLASRGRSEEANDA